jgi:lysozyme family protein
MQSNYAPFADRMIQRYEGGYGWDKKDPGGPTKYGITCFDLAEHRGQKMDSMDVWAPIVKAMSLQEAEDIYAHKYATAVHFNELPSGIDCVMFDYGVNSGIARPIKVAAAILKAPYTGRMDSNLLGEIQRADPRLFIKTMNEERLRFMHAIRGGSAWAEFGHGWQARVDDLSVYSLALANKVIPPAPTALPPPRPDAPKVQQPKPNSENHMGGTSGAVIAAGTAVHDHNWMIVAGVIVAVLVAGVLVYKYRSHRANQVNEKVYL